MVWTCFLPEKDMTDQTTYPERIRPDIPHTGPNEPIVLTTGVFPLLTEEGQGTVDGRIQLRWVPTVDFEFEGQYSGARLQPKTNEATLQIPAWGLEVPAFITSRAIATGPNDVRGIFPRPVTLGDPIDLDFVRFHLVLFPETVGEPIRSDTSIFLGRLTMNAPRLACVVDEIPEAKQSHRWVGDATGYVVTHVGEFRKPGGRLDAAEVDDALEMLRLFFGFLRGAWTGPVFQKGYAGTARSWEQFGCWRIDEPREVPTWLPQRSPLDLTDLFVDYLALWSEPFWKHRLRTVVSWLIAANASRIATETRIILAQVALEHLAWTELVDIRKDYGRREFKRATMEVRMRRLLEHLHVPCEIPVWLPELRDARRKDTDDGPAVIAASRNGWFMARNAARERGSSRASSFGSADSSPLAMSNSWYLHSADTRASTLGEAGADGRATTRPRFRGRSDAFAYLGRTSPQTLRTECGGSGRGARLRTGVRRASGPGALPASAEPEETIGSRPTTSWSRPCRGMSCRPRTFGSEDGGGPCPRRAPVAGPSSRSI
jgi:hypothetical protein